MHLSPLKNLDFTEKDVHEKHIGFTFMLKLHFSLFFFWQLREHASGILTYINVCREQGHCKTTEV